MVDIRRSLPYKSYCLFFSYVIYNIQTNSKTYNIIEQEQTVETEKQTNHIKHTIKWFSFIVTW